MTREDAPPVGDVRARFIVAKPTEADGVRLKPSASSSEIHTCDQPAYTRFRMVAFASSAARASRNLIAGRGDTY